MSDPNTPVLTVKLSQEEYRSLRETVQRRGSLRFVVASMTWSIWAALALYSWTTGFAPLAGAIPLIVLFGGFEIVLTLHAGVERIGRYIQVAFESGQAAPPAWEHTAMAMGGRWLSPGGLDPLFSLVFVMAALVNAISGLAGGTSIEVAAAVITHAAFAIRILMAQQFVKRQRAHDLAALDQVISSNGLVSNIQQQR